MQTIIYTQGFLKRKVGYIFCSVKCHWAGFSLNVVVIAIHLIMFHAQQQTWSNTLFFSQQVLENTAQLQAAKTLWTRMTTDFTIKKSSISKIYIIMFQKFTKKEAAARRSSKMESRDHSNAANPKSLMSMVERIFNRNRRLRRTSVSIS